MKRLTVVLTSVAALVACGDSNSKYNASGIGSVELNDSVFAIHYYSNTLIISNAALRGGLRDSCRVYFSGSGELMTEGADGSVYDFTPSELSSDIRQPILLLDSVAQSSADTMRTASSREGFFAHNIHITRDWRRNNILDATCYYPGVNGGADDFFGFFADTTTLGTDSVKVWLRLCRAKRDSAQMVVRRISAPINCLRDTTRERVIVNIRRIDAYGDTVSTDLVYSYVNWIN